MPVTSVYAIPYQSLSDPPDGPNLGEDGFLAVETELARIDGDIAGLDVRIDALEAAWPPWTPTLTNLTLGDGMVTAKHRVVGKTLDFRFKFVLGSTSAVGTAPDFTLPFAVHADYVEFHAVAGGAALNAGIASYALSVRRITSTKLDLVTIGTNGLSGAVTATVPFTFGTGDSLFASGTVELA